MRYLQEGNFNYRVLTPGRKRDNMFLLARKLLGKIVAFTFGVGFVVGLYLGMQVH